MDADDAESAIGGLEVADKLEQCVPKIEHMAWLMKLDAAKSGDDSTAESLCNCIAGAPPGLVIPDEVLGKVPRRAALHCLVSSDSQATLDIDKLAEICTIEGSTHPHAIGSVAMEPMSRTAKVALQDSIMKNAFCNLARDPSTPKSQVIRFLDVVIGVCDKGGQMLNIFEAIQTANAEAESTDPAIDKLEVSLNIIKAPDHDLSKPMAYWAVLKDIKAKAAAIVLGAQMENTAVDRLKALVQTMADANKSSATGIRVNMSRLMAFRNQLSGLQKVMTPAVSLRVQDVVAQAETYLTSEFECEFVDVSNYFMVQTEQLLNLILARVGDGTLHANADALRSHMADWQGKLGHVSRSLKTAATSGIKGFASDVLVQRWTQAYELRRKFVITLSSFLVFMWQVDGSFVLDAIDFDTCAGIFTDMAFVLDTLADSDRSQLMYPRPELVTRLVSVLTPLYDGARITMCSAKITQFVSTHSTVLAEMAKPMYYKSAPIFKQGCSLLTVLSNISDDAMNTLHTDVKSVLSILELMPVESMTPVNIELADGTGSVPLHPASIGLLAQYVSPLRDFAKVFDATQD